VRKLVDAHPHADVAYVAISASEKQQGGGQLEFFDQFTARLTRLGLGHLRELAPMMYFDVGYWDHAYLVDQAMMDLEAKIHDVLFPGLELEWPAFAAERGLDAGSTAFGSKWHNAKCDVQALWSHIHHSRAVFVTSDENYLGSKRPALVALGAGEILRPADAAKLLD
jgi:hypothetical protein